MCKSQDALNIAVIEGIYLQLFNYRFLFGRKLFFINFCQILTSINAVCHLAEVFWIDHL